MSWLVCFSCFQIVSIAFTIGLTSKMDHHSSSHLKSHLPLASITSYHNKSICVSWCTPQALFSHPWIGWVQLSWSTLTYNLGIDPSLTNLPNIAASSLALHRDRDMAICGLNHETLKRLPRKMVKRKLINFFPSLKTQEMHLLRIIKSLFNDYGHTLAWDT